jgi:hypothetical protein
VAAPPGRGGGIGASAELDAFAQAPEAGTQPYRTYAPNMFGDTFGGRGQRLTLQRPPIIIGGTPGTPAVTQMIGGTFLIPGSATPTDFTTHPVAFGGTFNPLTFTLTGQAALPGVNTTFSSPLTHVSQAAVIVGPNGLPSGSTVSLQEQPQVRQAVLQSATSQFGPGGTLTLNNSTATLLSGDTESSHWSIGTLYNYLIPGTPGTPPVIIPRPAILLNVPSPTGGVVGLTKISDDNSPLPRDRIIFDYDYFDSVPLTPQSNNVHRFSPGFEKTFFNQRASLEVRLPFASTISNDIVADGITNSGHGEFGDVHLTLKGLLYRGPVVNVAAGLGIDIPTADGITVSLLDGTKVAHISNDSWVLTPYFAFLVTPAARLFFQNWYQFGLSTNGNKVQANPDLSTGLQPVGSLTDQALFQLDAQLGYWVYRRDDPSRLLRGLAPFIELHYNSTMGKADSIQAGAFVLGDPNSHFDELNLTAGFVMQIRDNFNLAFGAAAPLKGHADRTFDWQVGVHASWFFGATARQQSAVAQTSSF